MSGVSRNDGRHPNELRPLELLPDYLEQPHGSVLFSRPYFEVRERYEISVDARTYFEESDVAMERLSRDVARSVVSAVLENF